MSTNNLNLETVVINRKARKGKCYGIDKNGAYWVPVEIDVNHYGGDGVGQAGASVTQTLEVHHYRNGRLECWLVESRWHQNTGHDNDFYRADTLLKCEDLETLIAGIQNVKLPREYQDDYFLVSSKGQDRLEAGLPELPFSGPSPDDE